MSLTAPSSVQTWSAPNFERSRFSAQSSVRSNFRAELLARAHPPYPPGGGAQTSPPARTFSARFKFALKVRGTDRGMVPSRQTVCQRVAGNSRQSRQTLFQVSGFSPGRRGLALGANGGDPGRPGHRQVPRGGPVGHGRRCWAVGGQSRATVGSVER